MTGHDQPEPVDPPWNVLLITTDQQRADHVGFGGNPDLATPNLDHLAASGTTFRRAYVANPICMPNRSSIVTGRYPSAHGTRVNGIALDPDAETWARVLRRAGYRTGLIGKSHLQPLGVGEEVMGRWLGERAAADGVRRGHEPGWDSWEHLARHARGWVDVPEDYYGFDHVRLTGGASANAGGHYLHWLRDQGADPARLGREHATSRYEGWDQVWASALPEELYTTSYITDEALDFLGRDDVARRGFALWVSYPDPHHPFVPPERFYHRHDPAGVTIPDTFGDPHVDSMSHVRRLVDRRGTPDGPVNAWAPTEEQLRHALAVQYGAIEMIDEAVGRLMAGLHDCGLADRTMVVFTSDHGDLFGDHGLLLKHAVHYDAVVRVPLVLRAPGLPGGQVHDGLASTLDLTPTILDVLGRPGYVGLQGQSLVPALQGGEQGGRTSLLVEEDEVFGLDGLPGPIRVRTLLTSDGHRYTRFAGQSHGELFDRSDDPGELDNRFARDRALRADLDDVLVERLVEAADTSRRPTHVA